MAFSREEHLKKIGFKKGYTPWNKGLKTGVSGMKDKKHTEESKKKMSDNNARYWEGKRFDSEHRKNLSLNHADFNDEKSCNWKGDNVGFVALHLWVAKHRGRPSCCEHCHRTDCKRFEWANVDHRYRRVLSDYIRLCTSCHRIYDIKFNNYLNEKRK